MCFSQVQFAQEKIEFKGHWTSKHFVIGDERFTAKRIGEKLVIWDEDKYLPEVGPILKQIRIAEGLTKFAIAFSGGAGCAVFLGYTLYNAIMDNKANITHAVLYGVSTTIVVSVHLAVPTIIKYKRANFKMKAVTDRYNAERGFTKKELE